MDETISRIMVSFKHKGVLPTASKPESQDERLNRIATSIASGKKQPRVTPEQMKQLAGHAQHIAFSYAVQFGVFSYQREYFCFKHYFKAVVLSKLSVIRSICITL